MCRIGYRRCGRFVTAAISVAPLFFACGFAEAGSAQRGLPDHYQPGQAVSVTITISADPGTLAAGLEDGPPEGWAVGNISDGGTWDSANKKVKWGPFFAPNIPAAVSYDATPPSGQTGEQCFNGTVSFDGSNLTITGDSCLTATPPATGTPTPTPTGTPTSAPTPTGTATPGPTPTPAPSATPTSSPPTTPTPTPTAPAAATPTAPPTAGPTATPSDTPTSAPTPTGTATPGPTPTPALSATPTSSPPTTPAPSPTSTPAPAATEAPSPQPPGGSGGASCPLAGIALVALSAALAAWARRSGCAG